MKQASTKIYQLRSENLTNLGLPMGKEYVFDNWIKYFSSILRAKRFAQKDFGRKEKIKWRKKKKEIVSGDLSFVQYYIKQIEMEE